MEHKRRNKKANSVALVEKRCSMDKESSVGPLSCQQHPLLFPEVLAVILKNLDGDYYSLRSCREVCRVWNTEACKILKDGNSPVVLANSKDLQEFHTDLKKPNSQTNIFKGLIFQGPNIQKEKEDYSPSALNPPSATLWHCFKNFLGGHITHLDISLVTLQKNDNNQIQPSRLRLSDFRKLIFVACPNLTHLVVRELQKQFVQKLKGNSDPQYQSKLKSLVLKNEIPNAWYSRNTLITNGAQRYHVDCNDFYEDLLMSSPNLEHVGFFFHLSISSLTYLEILAPKVVTGTLAKLESIERVSYGTTRTKEVGTHIDIASTRDLMARFKSIHFRSNLIFVPIQLTITFRRSWNSVEDLNVSAFYYNEANYLTAVVQFDSNRVPIPYMENLKKLCLRGGIPLEPFLLNVPNLQELVISFMGQKNQENEQLPPIKFWNKMWRDVKLSPLFNLWKLDVGHCVFICPHDIVIMATLCPNVKKLSVPFRSNGCIQEVFKQLPQIEKLDIVLLDDENTLTDDVFFKDSHSPGIEALKGLQALRIRVNEVSKLNDKSRNNFTVSHLGIADACLLTSEFIVFLSKSQLNLKILKLEVGQFTDCIWNNLTYDRLTSLTFLEVPKACFSSENALQHLRTKLPWTNVCFASYKPTKEGADINLSGLD